MIHRWWGAVACGCGLLGSVPVPPAGAGDRKETVETVTRGHAAALERLSQLSFLATFEEGEGGKRGKYTVRYWRSGDRWRMQLKAVSAWMRGNPLADLDICCDGSDIRSVTTRRGEGAGGPAGGVLQPLPAFRPLKFYDPWGAALLSLAAEQGALPLADFLAQGEVLAAEARDPAGDVLLRVKHDEEPSTLWVSPGRMFLVRKRSSDPDAEDRWETEVTAFHEPVPGVFFPARAEATHITKAGRVPVRTVTFTDVAVDKPHPPGTFALKFPRGTRLLNQVRNLTYETDADGNPIGKVETPPQIALLPTNLPDTGAPPRTETTEEPRSPVRYVLPAALAVLAAAGVAWAIRRRVRPAT